MTQAAFLLLALGAVLFYANIPFSTLDRSLSLSLFLSLHSAKDVDNGTVYHAQLPLIWSGAPDSTTTSTTSTTTTTTTTTAAPTPTTGPVGDIPKESKTTALEELSSAKSTDRPLQLYEGWRPLQYT